MAERPRSLEECLPPYDCPEKQPKTLTKNRTIDGCFYVAGRAPVEGQEQYDVMFVTTSVEEDEASTQTVSALGYRINQPAEYLRGPGGMVKDVALRAGIDMDKCYYTAVCKWLLPRARRGKPPMKELRWGMPILLDEIKRVKPKVIVCMGKPAFDLLSDRKIGFDDAHGGWFWSTVAQAHLYVMHAPYTLVGRPDTYETFRVDFGEIARKLKILEFGEIEELPVRMSVMRDESSLRDWADRMVEEGRTLYAADGEWHGRTYTDLKLRTFQFAWTESDAMAIEFRDETTAWSFQFDSEPEDLLTPDEIAEAEALGEHGVQYRMVGKLLSFMNGPDIRFIGHHLPADTPVLEHWLKIDTYRKCLLDTEFAQQAVDESSELGLERGIGMKYTTLGRYDLELVLWKKDNPGMCDDGYGYIPSDILLPYAMKDVLVPFRAYPFIKRQLEVQGLWEYYTTILNPFVTDCFKAFTMGGLPMDIPLMDDLRELFHFVKEELESRLRRRIYAEARAGVFNAMLEDGGDNGLQGAMELMEATNTGALLDIVKKYVPLEKLANWIPRLEHLVDAPDFNIRSAPHLRRWLFDVEGLEPIKTTNQKAKGMPSMAWEKVLELPADRRKLYTPAVDKQTLQILSEKCDTLKELLDLNAVGNLCKAFLKKAERYIDEETGEEVIEEHGLHLWLSPKTGSVHNQYSTTETGRPRAWMPNILNWPSYVNKRIARSVRMVVQDCYANGSLPDNLMRWVDVPEDSLPSIRSCVMAREGWVMVESDYKTAEMVGLGNISGDKDLLRILKEPDPEWAALKKGNPWEAKAVRVRFADIRVSGIPEAAHDPKFIMAVWKDGEKLGDVTEDMLERNADGSVKHVGYDIHWSIAERIYEKPRELMVEKIQRNAGKVINFSSAYGASPNSLERKIESDTGVKPEEGTGQKGLDAIRDRAPVATDFLEQMAEVPKTKGHYRAASGRIRHCQLHGAGSGVGWRTRNAQESALGREMRNFPMQESVGATAARACRMAIHLYKALGLKARLLVCLYDSLVTLCPLEERHVVARIHTAVMSELNTWDYEDEKGKRTLQYEVDNEFNYRWSTRPSKPEQRLLDSADWHPTPDNLKWLLSLESFDILVS